MRHSVESQGLIFFCCLRSPSLFITVRDKFKGGWSSDTSSDTVTKDGDIDELLTVSFRVLVAESSLYYC